MQTDPATSVFSDGETQAESWDPDDPKWLGIILFKTLKIVEKYA